MTPEEDARERAARMLETASFHYIAGDPDAATSVLNLALSQEPSGPIKARALLQLGVAASRSDLAAAHQYYGCARRDAPDDHHLGAEIEVRLAQDSLKLIDTKSAADHGRAALIHAEAAGAPELIAAALGESMRSEFLLGHGINAQVVERSLALERRCTDLPTEASPRLPLATILHWAHDLPRGAVPGAGEKLRA